MSEQKKSQTSLQPTIEKASKSAHICVSAGIAILGLWIGWISYTQEPAEAYLFPRLISFFIVLLSLWTFAKALIGRSKVGKGLSLPMVKNISPGVAVCAIYVFYGAKAFGFYTATFLCFLALLALYDPASHRQPLVWIKRVVITVCFTGVLYGLFGLLLKVYTPIEIYQSLWR